VPKRILVIDDVESVRRDIRNYINPPASARDQVALLMGRVTAPPRIAFQIDEAAQGEEGVEMVQAALDQGSPYDIVIVDMMMLPGINGVETIRRFRRFDKDAFVIICTGNGLMQMTEVVEANLGIEPALLHKSGTQVAWLRFCDERT